MARRTPGWGRAERDDAARLRAFLLANQAEEHRRRVCAHLRRGAN